MPPKNGAIASSSEISLAQSQLSCAILIFKQLFFYTSGFASPVGTIL